jgi:hypothetical protein
VKWEGTLWCQEVAGSGKPGVKIQQTVEWGRKKKFKIPYGAVIQKTHSRGVGLPCGDVCDIRQNSWDSQAGLASQSVLG